MNYNNNFHHFCWNLLEKALVWWPVKGNSLVHYQSLKNWWGGVKWNLKAILDITYIIISCSKHFQILRSFTRACFMGHFTKMLTSSLTTIQIHTTICISTCYNNYYSIDIRETKAVSLLSGTKSILRPEW